MFTVKGTKKTIYLGSLTALMLGAHIPASMADETVPASANVKVVAPRDWYRDSLFTAVRASRSTMRATYELVWIADGLITAAIIS